jgi:arylsulfatase A-like enzyme/cytochrome c-type biogenesis protein CcmH/NrfG
MTRRAIAALLAMLTAACSRTATEPPPDAARPATSPRTIVLVTIDTLRADHLGAYGYAAAHTPAIDALAVRGVRFDRAYATAPITLTSHASLLTGLAPPKHGARHNGMRLRADVPTLAERLKSQGWSTAAFVAAFPLERRFGLSRGFDVYSDALPRGADGRPQNERAGYQVVDEALAWLDRQPTTGRSFLWVHLFEPHAPYVDRQAMAAPPGGRPRSVGERYDTEIAVADGEVARLVHAVRPHLDSTLVVVASDHGEAFGEHGEIGHSVFIYDTTLRVPLVIAGPGIRPAVVGEAVSLVDVMPTLLELVGATPAAPVDGVSLAPALTRGAPLAPRAIYAESFAPLLDFGWSPLRSLRDGGMKYIAAPTAELYDLRQDAGETRNLLPAQASAIAELARRVDGISPASIAAPAREAGESTTRLQSLGYLAGAGSQRAAERPDPKDRVALASRIADVTSGELRGAALTAALEAIVAEEPRNGQMRMRLGYARLERGGCAAAVPHFQAAIAAGVPSAEPHLGLAECLAAAGQHDAAARALAAADRLEPGNPVVLANLGLMALDAGRTADAISRLRAALDVDPSLDQARFALARAYGRNGQRDEAAREARTLLDRLPPQAPQRGEVERLLRALQ